MTTATKPGASPTNDPVMTMRMRIAIKTRSIMAAEYELNDAIQLPVVAARVRDALKDDGAFMKRLDEMLYFVSYESARRIVAETRGPSAIADPNAGPVQARRQAEAKRTKWRTWLEHVGDRHVKLWDMDATALDVAATERESRGTAEIRLATFLRSLAALLEPGQTVGNRYEPVEVDRLYAQALRGEGGSV